MYRHKQHVPLRERAQRWVRRLFPERQIHLRTEGRVSFIRFSPRVQMALVMIFLATGGWFSFTSFIYVRHDAIVAAKEGLILDSRQAYRSLLGEVSEYQRKFTALTTDLEDSRGLMLGLIDKNASLQHHLTTVSKKLRLTRKEREEVTSARESLNEKLISIEDKMHKIASRNFSLSDTLNTAEADLQTALAERNKSLYEAAKMSRHIKSLEGRLANLQETEEQVIHRLTNNTNNYIDTMERVISLTGLNVQRILKSSGLPPRGMGGPFIAARPDLPAKQLKDSLNNLDAHLERWKDLENLMQRLPLSPPLRSFYVTSGFGKRRDPINRRWAAHYGLDLGGPFKSKVYATAPGVVTFAGWKGKYGKLVEISHGKGIKTRYGHLHKFYVKKGQKVDFHKKIGLLGSTGRSTGAHLHYEVIFKGRAKNPMKFIRAGYNVFQE